MPSKPQVGLVGATGRLGHPVLQELQRQGLSVTVLSRASQSTHAPVDVTTVHADLLRPETLRPALAGLDVLYLNLPGIPDVNGRWADREGLQNLARILPKTDVRHVLAISGLGVIHPEFAATALPANQARAVGQQALRDAGTPWTFFHCSTFLDSLQWGIRKGKFTVFGHYDAPLHFTNSSDYARLVAAALDHPAAKNQDFPVQGPEGMSYLEAAKRYFAATGGIQVKTAPAWLLDLLARLDSRLRGPAEILTYLRGMNETYVSSQTWKRLDVKPTTLEKFADG